jgi:ABC-2 type transport system permease protein
VRLLQLFAAVFSISLRRELAFRANLLFQALTTGAGSAAALAALGLVYTRTDTLGGWSPGEAIVLLGTYQIVSGVLATFVEPNLQWFAEQVTSGKFDDLLLKPAPSVFLASLGTCAPLGLSQVALGTAVVAIGLRELGNRPTPWGAAGWLLLLAVGIAIAWASRVTLASLAFWAPYLTPDVLYGALWQFGRYPVGIYRQPIRFVLTYLLPVAFIATIPARALSRGADPAVCAAGLAAGLGSVVVVQLVWKAGLRRYTSATS